MRERFIFCVLALVLCLSPQLSTPISAQEGGGGQPLTKENLDLPFDAFGIAEDEEDAPEVIFFYGQQYEGDGFFYVLDRSGSTRDFELAIEQRETVRNISEFTDKIKFGVVFYDSNVMKFPPSGQPAEASPGMKSSAIGWIMSVQAGSGTCVQKGLMEGLNFANISSAKRNQIILLTDGYTTCPGVDRDVYAQQTLAAVTGANYKRVPINTICVGSDVSETFPKTLAAMNGGSYSRVPR